MPKSDEAQALQQVLEQLRLLRTRYRAKRDEHSTEDERWSDWNNRAGGLQPLEGYIEMMIADRVPPDHPDGWESLGDVAKAVWEGVKAHRATQAA